MYDLNGVPDPDVVRFVDGHIRSLLTWDIVVFFHRNPEAAVDVPGLAAALGRRAEEIEPEIGPLCESGVLQCAGGIVRCRPSSTVRREICGFVDACADRGHRLALIALVLHNVSARGVSDSSAGA